MQVKQEKQNERVVALALKIAKVLSAHPNLHEAKAACEIANSLASMRVKLSSLLKI